MPGRRALVPLPAHHRRTRSPAHTFLPGDTALSPFGGGGGGGGVPFLSRRGCLARAEYFPSASCMGKAPARCARRCTRCCGARPSCTASASCSDETSGGWRRDDRDPAAQVIPPFLFFLKGSGRQNSKKPADDWPNGSFPMAGSRKLVPIPPENGLLLWSYVQKAKNQFEGAIYHVINRGNYRSDVFVSERTKLAFEKCLFEVCELKAWRLHAYIVMHAITFIWRSRDSAPRPNLVSGDAMAAKYICRSFQQISPRKRPPLPRPLQVRNALAGAVAPG